MKTVNVNLSIEVPLDDLLNFLQSANGGKAAGPKKKVKEPEPELEEDTDEDLTGAEEEEESTEITEEIIGELVTEKVKGGKKEKVIALLAKYKAKKVSNLKPAQYEAFYTALKKV